MSFVHMVTSIVDDSFVCSSFFVSITQIQYFSSFIYFFPIDDSFIYIERAFCKFQPGAPHYLNPPLLQGLHCEKREESN